MHILVTDVVSCPRCGPDFGLIVLADLLENRRILEGRLGCGNCREEYAVHEGVADLRVPGATSPSSGGVDASSVIGGAREPAGYGAERAYRLAALLGVTGPAGPVVVVTAEAAVVAEVQRQLPDAGVIGVSGQAPAGAGEAGLGWLLTAAAIPFRSRSLGGVALALADPFPLLDEALRCLAPGARLVIDPAPREAGRELLRRGAEVLLDQDQVVVASGTGAG